MAKAPKRAARRPQPVHQQSGAAADIGGAQPLGTHLGELRHLLGQPQVQLWRELLELHLSRP
eukprot:scaffold5870_cov93-Isochrysis_galbana.AAC.3